MKQEVLTADKSQKIISGVVELPKSELVKKIEQISISVPLVLKIISDMAIHKTEIGGVRIVHHKEELSSAWEELELVIRKNKLKIKGILVQEFVEGQQFIIGIKKDAVFGHVIVFGAGGIFTEILSDVAIRKCPIDEQDADSMMEELKIRKLFHGFRNISLNTAILKDTLVSVSKLPIKNKNIKELDINPFILNDKTGYAVDVRIVNEI